MKNIKKKLPYVISLCFIGFMYMYDVKLFKEFMLVFGTLFFACIIHEIGHAIAGVICGFEFVGIGLFNIHIIKKNNNFELKLGKKFSLFYVSMNYKLKSKNKIILKLIIFSAGGILLNVIVFLLSLTTSIPILKFIGACNLICTILTTFPFYSSTNKYVYAYSDVYKIYKMINDKNYKNFVLADLDLELQHEIGLFNKIELQEEKYRQGSEIIFTITIHRYYRALAAKDFSVMINCMEILYSHKQQLINYIHESMNYPCFAQDNNIYYAILCEMLYYGVKNDMHEAKEIYEVLSVINISSFNSNRCLNAYLGNKVDLNLKDVSIIEQSIIKEYYDLNYESAQ